MSKVATVGVAIPSIPSRERMLARAVRSVIHQTRPCDELSIVLDEDGAGAASTRNRAWRQLTTDYVAFLDDDDEFLPDHLEQLLASAELHGADMVYPWFEVVGGVDPYPHRFGQPFDPDNPIQTTIVCLWRRTALETIGGFPTVGRTADKDALGHRKGEDLLAVEALIAAGGSIVHLPARTWRWHHHEQHTFGLSD